MKKVDTNMVIALAALVTSVVAVFIAWDESRLMRESQEAAFIPIIEIDGGANLAALELHLRVQNTGHGVAFVESLRLLDEERPVTTWAGLSRLLLNEELDPLADLSTDRSMGYYPIGEERTIVAIMFPEEARPLFRQHAERMIYNSEGQIAAFDVEACYCSVFGRCWTKRMKDNGRPQPVDACTPTTEPVNAIWNGFVASRQEDLSNE